MPHICADEILMFMALFPFIGVLFHRAHTWYHLKFGHKCHHKTCDDKHVDHYSPYDRVDNFQQVSEDDMKYLSGTPVPLKITVPVEIEK